MAIVGIYKLSVSNSKLGLTKEEMANKALPFLIPLSIENGLSVAQFNIIINLIKDMMNKIETEHRTKLEQLNAIQDTQKSSLQMSLSENMTLSSSKIVAAPAPSEASAMDSMFDGLGLGDYVNSDKSHLVNSVIGSSQDKQNSSNNISSNIPQPSSSSSSLSLQQKKQMMQQQQQSVKTTPTTQPTNLTDSLIAKSMSMNAMSSSSTNQSSSINQSWSNNSGWSSSVSQQQSFSNQGFGGFASAPMKKPPTMMQQQQQQKPDLSAFDSLLSPSSSMTNKQPMNAMRPSMTSQTSSLLQPQQSSMMNNNINQGSKQLSMNDINDLLS